MFLRADASIVVKAAKSLERKGGNGNNLGLANLIVNRTSVYAELTRRAVNGQRPPKKEHAAIFNLIEKLGPYHRLHEIPTIASTALCKHTGPSLAGPSSPQNFALEALKLLLATAQNTQSTMSAQLFVHTRRIELGKLLTGGFRFQTPTSPRDHRISASRLLGALVDGVDEDMDVMAGLIVHRKPYETACGGNGLGLTFGNQRPKRRWKGPGGGWYNFDGSLAWSSFSGTHDRIQAVRTFD
ncbi:hypothetical protein HO133_008842 [Letharia lupina]|uniref:Uncharacterized protein n=1 Tax=Letharia lupina TaxID=560253 RepID=A0A8H6CPV6_9LECA|nr:uncharacterized protein HO133_008842 [Letharia lupina]KAF6227398.1 hypothetical protein HO133_008842 [Letharia lupina]